MVQDLECPAETTFDDRLVDEVRATLYGLLGCLYGRELTLEFAGELRKAGFFEILARVDPGFDVGEDLESLDLESLEVEFARLFIGPGPHAPPYASVYREDDGRSGQLWGSTTGEVRRFMAHFGLELDHPGAIPDHVSVLFEFMERVLRAKIEAGERNDEEAYQEADRIQRRFFSSYIDPWIGRFLQRVQQAEPLPFYAAVARFAAWFMNQEKLVA